MDKYFAENIVDCSALLCLNGELPPLSFFLSLPDCIPIIAADGAANKLYDIGLIPDAIVGDLDSFDAACFAGSYNSGKDSEKKIGSLGENLGKKPIISKISDQNWCDFEKALYYIACSVHGHNFISSGSDEEEVIIGNDIAESFRSKNDFVAQGEKNSFDNGNGNKSEINEDVLNKDGSQISLQANKDESYLSAGKVLVLGISGGSIDHVINNFNIVLRFSSGHKIFDIHVKADIIFYSYPIWGFLVNPGNKKTFPFGYNTKVSFFGFGSSKVRTSGLKWELQGETLNFPGFNSSFNRVAAPSFFTVEVLSDDERRCNGVIVLIYEKEVVDHGC